MPIDRAVLEHEIALLAGLLTDTPPELAALSAAIYLEDVAGVRLADDQIGPWLLDPGAVGELLDGSAGAR